MARSFYPINREQSSFLPENMMDWLAPDDLALFVIDAVGMLDLSGFYAQYKDGSGQKAYSPEVMLPLLVYAYCLGIRSSRQIERHCHRDVSFRVITCNEFPDHTTIARFRDRFREQLQQLFLEVLQMCREAGMGKLGVVAIDGTKIKANAAMEATKTRKKLAQMVELMFDEAQQIDAQENDQFGPDKRGDELPEQLRSPASRRKALEAARQRQQRIQQAYSKADGLSRKKMDKYDETEVRRLEKQERTGHLPAARVPEPPRTKNLTRARQT